MATPTTFDIGGTDTVNRLGFGAMRLCGPQVLGPGPPADPDRARSVVEQAVELGVDLIDTADAYGPGTGERLLRETIDTSRDELTVATKGGLLRNPDGDWIARTDPAQLKNAALASCDRLGVECIDLYQLHTVGDTPLRASVHALAELQDRGLIRHVGVSNVTLDQLELARDVCEIAAVQNQCSVVGPRQPGRLGYCEANEIAYLPYFPLAGGDLGGGPDEALEVIAAAHDATRHQIALAWLLHRSPVVCPIPGTSDPTHLAENVGAAAVDLSDEEVTRLTERA